MPTERHGWVRRGIREGKAKVVQRAPFTVQLNYESEELVQPLTIGQDIGFARVGISVTSETKEVFAAEYKIRTDVSELVTVRKSYRRTRRRNKTRYRAARFDNRKRKVLQPSIKQKVETHEQIIKDVKKILPVSRIIIEVNNFDMAKIKNPNLIGTEYQNGLQKDFYNVKQYILARDSYTCQAGKKGCVEKLHVHHLVFRCQGGGDSPDNLITLCEKHHTDLHAGKLHISIKKHKILKSATMMNVLRSQLLRRNPSFIEIFGYETKFEREMLGIPKTHVNDAFIISGGTQQKRAKVLSFTQKRRNNRSIQQNRKGQAPSIRKKRYKIQPKDIIQWQGKKYQAGGMQNKGAYLLFWGEKKTRIVKPISQIKVVFHHGGFYRDAR